MNTKVKMTRPELRTLAKQYRNGESLESLAAQYDLSAPTVRRLLTEEAGETIRPRGRIPKAKAAKKGAR